MKKRILSAGILTAMMLFSPIAGNIANASTQQTTQKIMWGANELADTQIGRIVFLKDTKLYKRDGKNPVQFHLNAKKGSMWRVHKITMEGNMNVYDLGGGVRVQQSNLSNYEAVPTALIEKQVKENGAHISWAKIYGIDYPQVRRLASKDVEGKINIDIKVRVEWLALNTPNTEGTKELRVTENKNNRLTILEFTSLTETEVGGEPTIQKLTTVYDVTTGKIIKQKLD